jgi:hypothetical protein
MGFLGDDSFWRLTLASQDSHLHAVDLFGQSVYLA